MVSNEVMVEEILNQSCGSCKDGKNTNKFLARQATEAFIKDNLLGRAGRTPILQEIRVLAARCYHDGFLDGIAKVVDKQ